MAAPSRISVFAALLFGIAVGTAVGYLLAQERPEVSSAGPGESVSTEIAKLRAELDDLKERDGVSNLEADLKDLQTIVADIMLRGDEVSLRAEFAQNAERLNGIDADKFALWDSDGDGTDDLAHLEESTRDIVSGETPVGLAKKANTADNAAFLGDLCRPISPWPSIPTPTSPKQYDSNGTFVWRETLRSSVTWLLLAMRRCLATWSPSGAFRLGVSKPILYRPPRV